MDWDGTGQHVFLYVLHWSGMNSHFTTRIYHHSVIQTFLLHMVWLLICMHCNSNSLTKMMQKGIWWGCTQTWAEAGFGFTKPAFLGSRLRLPRILGAWLWLCEFQRLRLRGLPKLRLCNQSELFGMDLDSRTRIRIQGDSDSRCWIRVRIQEALVLYK